MHLPLTTDQNVLGQMTSKLFHFSAFFYYDMENENQAVLTQLLYHINQEIYFKLCLQSITCVKVEYTEHHYY